MLTTILLIVIVVFCPLDLAAEEDIPVVIQNESVSAVPVQTGQPQSSTEGAGKKFQEMVVFAQRGS